MRSHTLFLGLTLFDLAITHPSSFDVPLAKHALAIRRGCQVSDDSSNQFELSPRQFRRQQNSTLPSSITVDVNFHIASTEVDADLITNEIIASQFSVLHEQFAVHNINLVLNSTERVVDNLTGSAFLVNEAPPGEYNYVYHKEEFNAYMKSTRRGGYDALNLYFYSSYSPGATGYCQFPAYDPVGETEFWTDSCQISAGTMPGMPADRTFSEWNLGHIAVHETGHWFGLNHTFAGGCSTSSPGDFVDDTPATADQYGCPTGADSCPGLPGLDPINNFMGYTDDSWYATCLLLLSPNVSRPWSLTSYGNLLNLNFSTSEFTPGQQARMFGSFFSYRRRS